MGSAWVRQDGDGGVAEPLAPITNVDDVDLDLGADGFGGDGVVLGAGVEDCHTPEGSERSRQCESISSNDTNLIATPIDTPTRAVRNAARTEAACRVSSIGSRREWARVDEARRG